MATAMPADTTMAARIQSRPKSSGRSRFSSALKKSRFQMFSHNAMHRLELSCKTQIAAMSCNTRLIEVPPDVVEATYNNYQPHVRRPFGVLDWPALLRKLDRIDASFRD